MKKLSMMLPTAVLLGAMAVDASATSRPDKPKPTPQPQGNTTEILTSSGSKSNLEFDQDIYVKGGDTFIKEGDTYVPVTLNSDTEITYAPTTELDVDAGDTYVPVTVNSETPVNVTPVTNVEVDGDELNQKVNQGNVQNTTYKTDYKIPVSTAVSHAPNVITSSACNPGSSGGLGIQTEEWGFSFSLGGTKVAGIPGQYNWTIGEGENQKSIKKPINPWVYLDEETSDEEKVAMNNAVAKKYQDDWSCALTAASAAKAQLDSNKEITQIQVEGQKAVATTYADAQKETAKINQAGTAYNTAVRHACGENGYRPSNPEHSECMNVLKAGGTMFFGASYGVSTDEVSTKGKAAPGAHNH